jgi:hypothetical protein
MNELHDDFRASADDLAADAGRLKSIEEEKATLDAADPRLVKLSEDAEQLVDKMVDKASVQTSRAKELNAEAEADAPAS